jgi:N-acetylneuraminic acid mutarotase
VQAKAFNKFYAALLTFFTVKVLYDFIAAKKCCNFYFTSALHLSYSVVFLSALIPLTFSLPGFIKIFALKKNMSMQKIKSRFKLSFILLCLMAIVASCTKTSTDDTDITGNWKRSSEFEGVGRTEAVTFTVGDKVYVGSGYDGTNRLNDFWEYNQTNGTWLRKADFPGAARNSAVAFAANGKGYVGTGYDGLNRLNDFWEYNPSTNVWTRIADFGGTARYGAVAFSISDKGYVSAGYDGNFLKDLWEYSPASNSWTQKASITGSKRTDATAFVYNSKAYVVTGINNGSYLNDFWMYDPVADAWTEKRKITSVSDDSYDDDYSTYITRSNATSFIMSNKAYLVAGSRSGVIGTAWEYDIANDTWAEKTGFEGTARESALSFTINNRGYVTTGNNSSSYFDDLWEFFPDADQIDTDN